MKLFNFAAVMQRMVYHTIKDSVKSGNKQFALLIDPDKPSEKQLGRLCAYAVKSGTDFIFIGGSFISKDCFRACVKTIRESCSIPLIIFPGSTMQIDKAADAILFLSLISGRNADLLIGKHVTAAPVLRSLKIEVIPTGYMVIESGKLTSVQYISGTMPLPGNKPDLAAHTALAGQMLGLKLIFMDAGSGAIHPVSAEMIKSVKQLINIPLIVGGGIDSAAKAKKAVRAGADIIVAGNAIEKNKSSIFRIADAVHEG